MIALFIEGKGFGRVASLPLALKVEDRQRAKERKVLRRTGLPGAATIFILGPITTVVLAILDTPVVAGGLEHFRRRQLVSPQAGYDIADVAGFFINSSLAQVLSVSFNLQDLRRSRQPQGLGIGQLMPDPIGRDPSVPFVYFRHWRGKNRL